MKQWPKWKQQLKARAKFKERRRLWDQQGGRCYYCSIKVQLQRLTIDHYDPKHLGGSDRPWNKVGACGPCNSAKGRQTPAQFIQSSWLAGRRAEIQKQEAGQ